ncbi:flagellar biosynthetic protein FliQ [Roseicella aquatilis]|uniref:Flagellar biosynthetic protein FliQ n=1 Tax=Roseicella aquatilis TaxID=2527868 RepID=A0A4R4D6J7_9PROT|nr:flagellar biosynthetic protein FliQ [Roseicella aquatilis]TCZ53676.1 flagellar biosynthetic protein FliQ [Roseicella aquatilis]
MDMVAMAGQQALWTALLIGGPLLLLLLVIGLCVSVLQALTQVQEASLAFVPKMFALGVALLLGAPAAAGIMRAFAATLFDGIVAVGGLR